MPRPPGFVSEMFAPVRSSALRRVRARLVDERVERGLEVAEVLAPGVADDRDHQRAAAVLLLDVDGDAEVHPVVVDAVRLAVDVGEVVGHHRRVVLRGEGDGVGDQVRERDPLAGVLELLAAAVHRRDGDRAERGRGRDRPALVHVAGEHPRAAAERLGRAAGRAAATGRLGGRRAPPPLVAVASTSAFVMRPPGPEPRTPARSMPSAAAMRAATGEIFASAGSGRGRRAASPSPAASAGRPGRRASRPTRRSSPSSSAR